MERLICWAALKNRYIAHSRVIRPFLSQSPDQLSGEGISVHEKLQQALNTHCLHLEAIMTLEITNAVDGPQLDLTALLLTACSPFMRLPTELRDLLYGHLLPNEADIGGALDWKVHSWGCTSIAGQYEERSRMLEKKDSWEELLRLRRDGDRCHPAILAVNKQIHAEASRVLYARTYTSRYLLKSSASWDTITTFCICATSSIPRSLMRFRCFFPSTKSRLYGSESTHHQFLQSLIP